MPQFSEFSESFLNTLENGYDNFLLLGKAGTGKSTLIGEFLKRTRKNVVVLGSTGIAAINIGGQTIHSFFGFPPRTMRPNDPEIITWPDYKPQSKLMRKLDTVIIDEISMVRPDLLDAISDSLCKQLNTTEPFGGLQMVLIGDVFQLAPVSRQSEADLHPGLPPAREYKSSFFFSSHAFKQGRFRLCELDKVYRQEDEYFLGLLGKIRTGDATAEVIETLNKRVADDATSGILLSTTNAIADAENARQLNALPGKERVFSASFNDKFSPHMLPAEEDLRLKVGARVMTLTNDPGQRWSNGSTGTVIDFSLDDDDNPCVEVAFDRGNVEKVPRYRWENSVYRADKDGAVERKVAGSATQYPLRLAWAVTIHKSQGLTFNEVRVHLGRGAFAGGQLYVALSRCRTLEGLSLLQPATLTDVFVDPIIHQFYAWFANRREEGALQPIHHHARRPQKPAKASKRDREQDKERRKKQRQSEREAKNLREGKAAREGMRWAEDEEQQVIDKFRAGASLQNIATELKRSPSAVGSRLKLANELYAFNVHLHYVVFCNDVDELAKLSVYETPDWTEQRHKLLVDAYAIGRTPEEICRLTQAGPLQVVVRLLATKAVPRENFEFGPLRVEFR